MVARNNSPEGETPPQRVSAIAIAKLDVLLTLPLTIYCLLSFLNTANIGNAGVGGLKSTLNITDKQFSTMLTTSQVAALIFQLPLNLLHKKIGSHIMIPAMVVVFGIITTLQGLVRSYRGLLAARFLISLCEGGVPPGVALYVSSLFPKKRIQLRLAVISTAVSMAGAFSGLLATGILHMDGIAGLYGWSWIFILEGLVTVILAFAFAFALPASIQNARLLNLAEKEELDLALASDGLSCEKTQFHIRQVVDALMTPHLWLFGPLCFMNTTRVVGIMIFAPFIVNEMIGRHPIRAELLTVPPYAVSFVVVIAVSTLADKWGFRGASCMFFSAISAIGYAISITSTNEHVNYFALVLQVVGASGVPAGITAWTANNFAPYYKRATALALVLTMSIGGGMLSTWLFNDPPRYIRANTINLAFSIAEVILTGLAVIYLWRRNVQKMRIRSASPSGKSSGEDFKIEQDHGELDDRDANFVYYL